MAYAETKAHAHELIDRMAPGQVSVIVHLLEVMLDPVSRTIANAPFDDEPAGEEEELQVAESRAAFARGEGIPMEEILADFGLTTEDFEHMSRTPLVAEDLPVGR